MANVHDIPLYLRSRSLSLGFALLAPNLLPAPIHFFKEDTGNDSYPRTGLQSGFSPRDIDCCETSLHGRQLDCIGSVFYYG